MPCLSTLYANLPGLRASESTPATLPTSISTSIAKPDIVLTSEDSITMFELIIVTNSQEAMQMVKERKSKKPNYMSLIFDLEERGLKVTYLTLEIGSFGHYFNSQRLLIVFQTHFT